MIRKVAVIFAILLLIVLLSFIYGVNEKIVFALPAVAEWKTGNFTIEIKDWDNPLGIEGKDNSGLNQSTCTYKVESLSPTTGAWETIRTATQRTCAIPIPITVGPKTGEGYKGTTGILVQTADCKYSGENSCRITAWAEDYAGNNSFGTEYMLTRIYSIDFGPPQAKITGISPLPSFPTADDRQNEAWLRAEDGGATNRKYAVNVEYTGAGESDLTLCQLHIKNGLVWNIKSVSCTGASKSASFDIWVGPNLGADCNVLSITQKNDTCILWARVWDKVGNENPFKYDLDKQSEFALPGKQQHWFPLQVDWQKPSAQ